MTNPAATFDDVVKMTSFVVELEPITVEADSGVVYNPCGIEHGGTAKYYVNVEPTMGAGEIWWEHLSWLPIVGFPYGCEGSVVSVGGYAPAEATLGAHIDGFRQTMPTIELEVLDKTTVDVHVYIIRDDSGHNDATTEAHVADLLDGANKIFQQVAMELRQDTTEYINNSQYLDLTSDDNWAKFDEMCSTHSGTGGIELYFVRSLTQKNPYADLAGFTDTGWWTPDGQGTAIADKASASAVAHEIGHVAGLEDIFHEGLGSQLVREAWEPEDWSGGAGTRYYPGRAKQGAYLINELLMFGADTATAVDIPKGRVYGLNKSAEQGMREVGLEDMGDRTPEHS